MRGGDLRWNPYEWDYERQHDQFETANAMLGSSDGTRFFDQDDPLGFVKFKAGLLAAMVLALADLDKEGYFGKGKARDAVTLFCSIPNSEDTLWFEMDSAKRLNPRGVFKTFLEQRIAWINSDRLVLDDFAELDSIYSHYLTHIKRKRS